jgi:hypothetical protein
VVNEDISSARRRSQTPFKCDNLIIIGTSITEFAKEALKGVVELPIRGFESETALSASA